MAFQILQFTVGALMFGLYWYLLQDHIIPKIHRKGFGFTIFAWLGALWLMAQGVGFMWAGAVG